MGGALDAVLAKDSVEEQEDVGIHSMYSGQALSISCGEDTRVISSHRRIRIAEGQDSANPSTRSDRQAGQEARTLCTTGIGPQIA